MNPHEVNELRAAYEQDSTVRKWRRRTRMAFATVLALLGALMLAVTLTAPAIAATAPAILTLGLAAAAFMCWPRQRKVP